jgi:hypothetical protein
MLIERLKEQLPAYAVPKAVHFVQSLPASKGVDAKHPGT